MDKSIAELVKERREELGISQIDLATRVGTSQATIDKIENGRSARSRFLPQIFHVLDLALDPIVEPVQVVRSNPFMLTTRQRLRREALDASATRLTTEESVVPGSALVGAADLPIYASVRGGAIDDSVLVSPEPIDYVKRPEPLARAKNGYGLYIVGDSMEPAFRQGDLALIHPNMPPKAGDEVVVCSQDVNGEHYAIIKLLTKVTATTWHLKQYNPGPGEPAEFTLDRGEWPICHLVVGSYRRR